jgi:hypothetical protein
MFRGATILSVLIMIVALIGPVVARSYLSTFRFEGPPPLAANWSNVSEDQSTLSVWTNRYDGLSVIELIHLAFGGYDISRSESVFIRQLEFFFGQNSTDRIDYSIAELRPDNQLMIYNISGTTVLDIGANWTFGLDRDAENLLLAEGLRGRAKGNTLLGG